MAHALVQRMSPHTKDEGCSRDYRSMTIIEMAREFLGMHGVTVRGKSALEVASLAATTRAGPMATGDFTALLSNVASKRLRNAYDENPGTYTLWARRAPDAPDFKEISVVQMSGAPELLQTNEAGEFKYGTMTDGAEKYKVITYGRIITLTRQAMVNDDLRGFDRMVQAFAGSARRLENRLVYSQLTANAALSDGTPLFHANHANLGASALSLDGLAAGRLAMRQQKGMNAEELNVAPSYLIVPGSLEQTAYNLTSANYVPVKQADISQFSAGGKTALQPIIEPLLDSGSQTAWYLAANSSQIDTVEYCYLSGSDGPMIESEASFSMDGISMRCRHDFATKAIDHRGLYKSAP